MSTVYEDDVLRGVELLDEEAPGWRDKIDLPSLHLMNCNSCVLGQVFGDFETGCNELGLTWYEAKEYGFVLDSDAPHRYAWLTRTWRKVLAR